MKKAILPIIISLAAVLLASCYFTPPAGDTSSITLTLSESAVARVVDANADTARVYLLSENNALLNFGDAYYFESGDFTASNEITVEGIPSGTWKVLLSLGKYSGDAFMTLSYGGTDGTVVSPGVEAKVGITLKEQPYNVAGNLLGKDVSGVVNISDTMYASSGNTIYSGTAAAVLNSLSQTISAEYTINSISKGLFFSATPNVFTPELWVNTDKGIVPYRGGAFNYTFHDDGVSVLKSGALETIEATAVWDSNDKLAVFYQRPKGLGGASIGGDQKDDPSTWSWTDLSELEDSISDELVLDFAVHGDNGYFASTIGAFRLNKGTVEAGGSDWISEGTFFEIVEGEETLLIYAIEVDETTNVVYIGTSDGMYKASLDDEGNPVNPSRISGTEGYGFTKISVTEDYAAFLSSYDLFIYETGTGSLTPLPFYSGLPGMLTGLSWKGSVLFISGTGTDAKGNPVPLGKGGLVSINMADLP